MLRIKVPDTPGCQLEAPLIIEELCFIPLRMQVQLKLVPPLHHADEAPSKVTHERPMRGAPFHDCEL